MKLSYRRPPHQSSTTKRESACAEVFRIAGTRFGPLETKLLALLWSHDRRLTVRAIHTLSSELAYTTILTTLDRLFRKGLLRRHKEGRAFAYEPRCSRDELLGELMSGQLTHLLTAAEESKVLLSTLVRAVGNTDSALLEELDSLVRAERMRLKMEDE